MEKSPEKFCTLYFFSSFRKFQDLHELVCMLCLDLDAFHDLQRAMYTMNIGVPIAFMNKYRAALQRLEDFQGII